MAIRWESAVATVLLLTALCGASQMPGNARNEARTKAVLDHLAAASATYARAVPSFACTEVIHTRLLRNGREKQHADYETAVRVVRRPDGALDESFFITLFNGKPPEIGKGLPTITYLDGGLSKGLPSFFTARQRECYRYTLHERRIDFTADPQTGAACTDAPSTEGFGLLDDNDNLLHGEVRRSAEDARRRRNPTLAAIDYAAVRLGYDTYHLPSHLYAETSTDANTRTTFDAHYEACHLYRVTATILPADGIATDGPPK